MTQATMPVYAPPDRTVRITASYTPAQVGDCLVPGHPEHVEIELAGDSWPTDPAHQAAFLTSLVDSLFRNEAPAVKTVVNHTVADPCRHLHVASFAKGGGL
jgi:hypothetical protein